MKRFVYLSGLVALLPLASWATSPIFENRGSIITPPVIDATNFVNFGQINIVALTDLKGKPFDTTGTWNVTNFGSMLCVNGFRFDHVAPDTGLRTMAANFV